MRNLDIILNNSCNLTCYYCESRWWQDSISYKQAVFFLVKYYQLWYKRVTFSGWEPLLYIKLFSLISFAQKLGYRDIRLQTNTLLGSHEFLSELISKGVTTFDIPFFSTDPESFSSISGSRQQDYLLYYNNIDFLLSQNVALDFSYVFSHHNTNTFSQDILYLKHKASSIFFKNPFSTSNIHLKNNEQAYTEILSDSLKSEKWIFKNIYLLFFPRCYFSLDFQDNFYDFSGDMVCDISWEYSLIEKLGQMYKKFEVCSGCQYNLKCIWVENNSSHLRKVFPK